jgi:hypothetical protein
MWRAWRFATTKPDSDTAVTKPGKTARDGQPTGKVDSGEKKPTTSVTPKAPAAKRDRKAPPSTKDAPVTVTDTEPTGEDPALTQEVTVTAKDPEPAAEDPTVTSDAPVTAKDPEPSAQEPSVSDSTAEASAPTVTEPKKPTKADLAKAIYDEMVAQHNPDRKDIIARFKKDAGLTTSGAASYYYKFQKDSRRVVEKGPTKMDKAREVFDALTNDGKARKEIIAALIKDVGLTKAGASTYYQTLKKMVVKPTE